jgi:hypothetical protein
MKSLAPKGLYIKGNSWFLVGGSGFMMTND